MSHDVDDWDQHWDAYAESAERNPAQRYRRDLALKLLERDGAPVRLVDIGAGQGDFLGAARTRWPQAELVGAEISAQGIEQARRKVPGARFELVDLIATQEPPQDLAGWGTHAVCSEVLEHVDDPTALMRHARGWLAPGAHVVVTVPGGPMSAFDKHIGHRQHFTPESLAQVLTSAGYVVEQTTGAGFPFFNLYRSVVIARGEKLVEDVSKTEQQDAPASGLANAVMAAFGPLFKLNRDASRRGWQTVGIARVPPSAR